MSGPLILVTRTERDGNVEHAQCPACRKGIWRHRWPSGEWSTWTHPARMKGGCRDALYPDARALDRCIAMFANPVTHGERVTLAQLKAKRARMANDG